MLACPGSWSLLEGESHHAEGREAGKGYGMSEAGTRRGEDDPEGGAPAACPFDVEVPVLRSRVVAVEEGAMVERERSLRDSGAPGTEPD